jgi:hypothetical protein
MPPECRPELVQVIQSRIQSEAAHNRLVNLALSARKTHRDTRILARLGAWLVERGTAIESRYALDATPAPQMR